MSSSRLIAVCGFEFDFALESAEAAALELSVAVQPVEGLPETFLLRFRAVRPDGKSFNMRRFSLHWQAPAVDMHGFYAGPPAPGEMNMLPYFCVKKQTCATTGFPFMALFHRGGANRAAFGLLDQLTETALEAKLSEATRSYHFHWHKPMGAVGLPTQSWQETLFVSTARRPWPDVLQAYAAAVDREWPQPQLPVPDSAYAPVFCTWTAIHHAVSQEWILRNARLAADLGFGTWLTDDGWFTDKGTFADYAYAGDWEPCDSKFPDFAGHVRAVQGMGLHYVLWVAPFMVGKASQAFQRYGHLLAADAPALEQLNFRNLSPQYRETGALVADLLTRLVRDYGLDGLKIDFVDSFPLDGEPPSHADYLTLGEGAYRVLSDAVDRLRALKPDVLIEVRNSYANLAARRYANLYRASDAPINFALNRWQVVMLRLLAPNRAVHLDPALWHPADSDEAVAVHLINLICSVPMVSVELDRYPQSHLDLIRHWIGFYQAHRDTIIHGQFAPDLQLGHIPLIRFNGPGERIIGLYEDYAFSLADGVTPLWILNGSTRPFVELLPVLPDGFAGSREVVTRDKFGCLVAQETLTFPRPRLAVEVGGSLEIRSD
jgi:alpha-galactosidase